MWAWNVVLRVYEQMAAMDPTACDYRLRAVADDSAASACLQRIQERFYTIGSAFPNWRAFRDDGIAHIVMGDCPAYGPLPSAVFTAKYYPGFMDGAHLRVKCCKDPFTSFTQWRI